MRLRAAFRMPARHGRRAVSVIVAGTVGLAAWGHAETTWADQTRLDARLQARLEEASRREAQVLVELTDRAMAGQPVQADFDMGWRHDFLKAQPGTFVPFILTLEPPGVTAREGLMYVRAARRREPEGRPPASERGRPRPERYPFDAIFPVAFDAEPGRPVRISRGFAVPAGHYDVYVALRERPDDPLAPGPERLKAGVLTRSITVPDFWSGELATSTVMLAHRIEALTRPMSPDEALERPYVIGLNDVHVAADSTFRRDRELIVVFVIYNPSVTTGGDFDVQVDYHVFHRQATGVEPPRAGAPAAREGERYVTRTSPQRFTRRALGSEVDPAAGHPVMAGQGILLSSFEAGEYRLEITVTDVLSGKRLIRDVTFSVVGS